MEVMVISISSSRAPGGISRVRLPSSLVTTRPCSAGVSVPASSDPLHALRIRAKATRETRGRRKRSMIMGPPE
jgi:hypothetical protein